jgi:hypothetical protein
MASLTKTVNITGTGDYTDLVPAIADILNSGLASSGEYTDLYLIVDSGYYTGYFSADIPYSGSLNIVGNNGSWFEPTATCSLSGIYDGTQNFTISNFRVVCSGISTAAFSIASGAAATFDDNRFIDTTIGISNSGQLTILSTEAHGTGSNSMFVSSPAGSVQFKNSSLGYFGVAASGATFSINSTSFIDNSVAIKSTDYVAISDSLVVGISGIIMNTTAGSVSLSNVTMDTSWECLNLNDASINAERCVFESDYTYSVIGTTVTGLISDSCFNSGTWDPTLSISGAGNITDDPYFNNTTVYDYRLVLRDTVGSPCVELVNNNTLSSEVTLITDQGHLSLSNSAGLINNQFFREFIYKQGNTLLFSNYGKETKLADLAYSAYPTEYSLYAIAEFSVFDIPLFASIDASVAGSSAPFPFDWDLKTFSTPEIVENKEYVIPRSVLNVSEAISGYIGLFLDNIIFGQMNKKMINPYLIKQLKGVSLDYGASENGSPVMWLLEGSNQFLSKINIYTGETLESYPLFTQSRESLYIYPSGLIPAGVFQDKYKFVLESSPQSEFFSDTEDGRFRWIATSIDSKKDIRGILAYKDNLYITLSEYNSPVENRSVTPTGFALGKLFIYSNNHLFEHYIANYTMEYAPSEFLLASGNEYPTDITVYEDGTFYIADYLNSSGLFKYKLAYDYALIRSSYDRDSLVILREDYSDVTI